MGLFQKNELLDVDKEAMEVIVQTPKLVAHAIRSFRFRDALSSHEISRAGNKYYKKEPWKLVKTDPEGKNDHEYCHANNGKLGCCF